VAESGVGLQRNRVCVDREF